MRLLQFTVEESEEEEQPSRQKHHRGDEGAGVHNVKDDADGVTGLPVKDAGDGVGDGG